jgi:predicted metal-dependent peptidase
MIEYDYWNTCADKVINKYIRLMKELHVVFSDTYIGYQTCEENKTYDLNKWYVAVTLFNNLHKEIDKFPKRNRGIIYAALKKFKF